METSSIVAMVMSLWSHPRNLVRSLVFKVPRLLLGLSPSLLKKGDHHIPGPPMEIESPKQLPQDVLMEIFALLELPDLKRACSVCSSWRSAYSSLCNLGQYKRHQTPCLLYTSESAGDSVAFLYSLAEKRSYKLTLPEPPIRTRYLIGSSDGWLVTVDERSEMHLLNPITCEQIALPSVSTIQHVTPVFDETGAVCKYQYSRGTPERVGPQTVDLDELRHYLQHKAFVFYDTSAAGGGYIVVLIHDPVGQLSFARLGDDKWTWLLPQCFFRDCIYKDGMLYALSCRGEIRVFDLRGPVVVSTELITGWTADYSCEPAYIVQTPSGDLMQVFRMQYMVGYDLSADVATRVHRTEAIKVFKVEDTMAENKLVEINSLKDYVLLLGHNQSLCLNAEQYTQLKANNAYITDDREYLNYYKTNRRDIGAFDLGNSTTEELVSPQLWSNWPTPVWITPSLTKMYPALGKQ